MKSLFMKILIGVIEILKKLWVFFYKFCFNVLVYSVNKNEWENG